MKLVKLLLRTSIRSFEAVLRNASFVFRRPPRPAFSVSAELKLLPFVVIGEAWLKCFLQEYQNLRQH